MRVRRRPSGFRRPPGGAGCPILEPDGNVPFHADQRDRTMSHPTTMGLSLRRRLLPALGAAVVLGPFGAPATAFDLQGHRGARGLAPENTLAAFRTALAIGVTTLETDLAVTRDGVLVISHDPFLNPDLVRTADGRWLETKGPPIRSLTLPELARYDIGRANPRSRYAQQFPSQQPADGERFP